MCVTGEKVPKGRKIAESIYKFNCAKYFGIGPEKKLGITIQKPNPFSPSRDKALTINKSEICPLISKLLLLSTYFFYQQTPN